MLYNVTQCLYYWKQPEGLPIYALLDNGKVIRYDIFV